MPYTPRSVRPLLVASALLAFSGACASTSPIDRGDFAVAKTQEVAPDALETNGERKIEHTESASLAFARAVLEHKAATSLDAGQREAVARALVAGEVAHGFPVNLSLAIIELESGFDPSAEGPAGSIGLMQLQPATARELALRHGFDWSRHHTLLDPGKNTRLGIAYLADMQSKFGSIEHAIAAYHIGPGNLRRLLARGPLRRGPYLNRVYARAEALRDAFGK